MDNGWRFAVDIDWTVALLAVHARVWRPFGICKPPPIFQLLSLGGCVAMALGATTLAKPKAHDNQSIKDYLKDVK